MKPSFFTRISIAVACFSIVAFAYYIHIRTDQNLRSPSAIPGDLLDAKQFVSDVFSEDYRSIFLKEIKVLEEKQRLGIQLPLKSVSGISLCKQFDNITLSFQAEGVAYSGEVPILKVKSQCLDMDNDQTVWLPIQKILKEQGSDNLQLSFYENTPISIEISTFFNKWPKHWVLVGVHFENTTNKKTLIYDQRTILRSLEYPISMHWDAYGKNL